MLRIRLRKVVRSLVALLALALPGLAFTGCGDAVGTGSEPLGGTYTGSATSKAGTSTYRLVIPENTAGSSSSFSVSGTVVEGGETLEVRGTGIYDHPQVTFELVRAGGGVEEVFGLSGMVSSSQKAITVSRGGATLVLSRD